MASRGIPSQVSVKTAFTVTVTVLAVAAGAWALWRATVALLVIAAALLVAVALNRTVEWLQRRGLSRGLGIAAAMLAVVAVFVGIGFVVVPPVVSQIGVLVNDWPRIVSTIERSTPYQLASRHLDLQAILQRAEAVAPQALGTVVTVLKGSVTALVAFVTILFVTLFMLTSGRPLVWALLAQARPERRPRYAEILRKVYHALGRYVAGHVFIVALQAVVTSSFLAIVGVPFFLPLGLVSALASLIPFAGVIAMGVLLSVIAWATNGLGSGIATVVYYVAYQQFESHLLYPLVYRRAVEVNPLVTIVAVLVLADLGGLAGAILAVPLAAVGHIVLREVFATRRERLGIPTVPPTRELLAKPPEPRREVH